MKPRRILHEKTHAGGTDMYISRKFTVEVKAGRILHEKTQRFLRGWWQTQEGVYINKEQGLVTFRELARMVYATLCPWTHARYYYANAS